MKNIGVGDVLAIKGGKLSLWNGKSLSTGFGGKLLVNEEIPHPKFRELRSWYSQQNFDNVLQLSQSNNQANGTSKKSWIHTIAEIEENVE